MNFSRRTILVATALTIVPLAPATVLAADHTIAGIVFQQDQYFRGVQIGHGERRKGRRRRTARRQQRQQAGKGNPADRHLYRPRRQRDRGRAAQSADGSMPALKKARDAGITWSPTEPVSMATCRGTVPEQRPRSRHRHWQGSQRVSGYAREAARSRSQRSLSSRCCQNKVEARGQRLPRSGQGPGRGRGAAGRLARRKGDRRRKRHPDG